MRKAYKTRAFPRKVTAVDARIYQAILAGTSLGLKTDDIRVAVIKGSALTKHGWLADSKTKTVKLVKTRKKAKAPALKAQDKIMTSGPADVIRAVAGSHRVVMGELAASREPQNVGQMNTHQTHTERSRDKRSK